MVSVCLPSDALLQHLPSYLGFSYLGRGVSLHGCSSKAQPMLLTLDEGHVEGWLFEKVIPQKRVYRYWHFGGSLIGCSPGDQPEVKLTSQQTHSPAQNFPYLNFNVCLRWRLAITTEHQICGECLQQDCPSKPHTKRKNLSTDTIQESEEKFLNSLKKIEGWKMFIKQKQGFKKK